MFGVPDTSKMTEYEEGEHLLETSPPESPPPQPAKKRERVLRLCIFSSVLFNIVLVFLLMFTDKAYKVTGGEPAVEARYQDGFSTDLGTCACRAKQIPF
jgi:hypothetical protein